MTAFTNAWSAGQMAAWLATARRISA
jgi:hypothetical protein